MTDEAFEAEIAKKQNELAMATSALEATRQAFLPLLAEYVASWWEKCAREEVTSNTKVTARLTDAQLGELKQKLVTLKGDAPRIVGERLGDGKAWWHLQQPLKERGTGQYSYGRFGNKIPDVISEPLRFVLGAIVPIMRTYGYLIEQGRDSWGGSGMAPRYAYGLVWPDDLFRATTQYENQVVAAEKIVAAISKLGTEQRQAAAGRRWDSA